MVCCRHLYRDGGWTEVPAGSEPEPIEFPPPLGKIRIFHCGHLEPLTIPRYIKVKGESKQRGVFAPEGCIDTKAFIAELERRGIEIYREEE